MNALAHHPDHEHGLSVEDALEFLNTHELESGELVDRLPSPPTRRRGSSTQGVLHSVGIGHGRPRTSSACAASGMPFARWSMRLSRIAVRRPLPSPSSMTPWRPAPRRAWSSTAPRSASGTTIRPRRSTTPSPCWPPDRGRARERAARSLPDVRQRHLPLDLLRRVAHGAPTLVRHEDLWQPGQGGPPSRARQDGPSAAGFRGHRARRGRGHRRAWTPRLARAPAGLRLRTASSTPRRTAAENRRSGGGTRCRGTGASISMTSSGVPTG